MNDLTVLNQDKGYKVSDRYTVVKTAELVSQFETNGYTVASFDKSRVNNKDKEGFQKHILRMRHPDLDFKIEGLTPEVVLINSYDRTSSFVLMLGVYRMICSNGLISGTSYDSIRVRHVGEIMPQVLNAAQNIQISASKLNDEILELSDRRLSQNESVQFANDIGKILVGKRDDLLQIDTTGLLQRNRSEDQQDDAFTILNVIQENALNGNIKYTVETEKGPKERKMRVVRAIDKNTEVNRAIWDRAAEFINAA